MGSFPSQGRNFSCIWFVHLFSSVWAFMYVLWQAALLTYNIYTTPYAHTNTHAVSPSVTSSSMVPLTCEKHHGISPIGLGLSAARGNKRIERDGGWKNKTKQIHRAIIFKVGGYNVVVIQASTHSFTQLLGAQTETEAKRWGPHYLTLQAVVKLSKMPRHTTVLYISN